MLHWTFCLDLLLVGTAIFVAIKSRVLVSKSEGIEVEY
jgi:hypothetical protein